MPSNPNTLSEIKEFGQSILADWLARVSGGFSVPFTIIATYSNSSYGKVIFGILALFALLFAAFRIWRNERISLANIKSEKLAIEEGLKPKLALSFDATNQACVTFVPNSSSCLARAFRLKVESRSNIRITGCSGKLISICGPFGNYLFDHQYIQLTFTHSEHPDTVSKTIDKNAPIYLDILATWNGNSVKLCAYKDHFPNGFKWSSMFNDKGEYKLRIQVAGDLGPPVECLLKFIWTGDWKTATMEMVTQDAPASRSGK